MCIKTLCYITDTYLKYYVQGVNPGQNLHERSTSWIGPILAKVGIFRYVPENDIKEDILGCNPSYLLSRNLDYPSPFKKMSNDQWL